LSSHEKTVIDLEPTRKSKWREKEMAVGPLARLLAQVIVPVIAVLARALPAAYAQALQNARKNGTAAAAATADSSSLLRKTMARSEALQILNLTETEATAEAIQRQYEKYMAANEVKPGTGGSFYLQSKVYRANELLSDFKKQQEAEKTENSTTDNGDKKQ
jgi:mitochondrial import inner membrane translocase subunit TIM16